MLALNESFIIIDCEAKTSDQVIEALAERLFAKSMVSQDYARATIARENVHPTGLPTKPFCIAFPHADADGVNTSALAIAILKEPVLFKNIADPDEDLSIEVVIMMANKDPKEQVKTLRDLANIFGEPEKLEELRGLQKAVDVVFWMKKELNI
ncbi:MAG: PTS sugar transporter subunit IIA [Anaerolineaceae bacterium]|nr:PTS sugar transporter subunit IIA [Anaerolineaceae bacterium]